ERGEHEEQVVLGDAELDVLAAPALGPQLRGGEALLLEHVGVVGAVEHAAPADPGAEAGRHGDVGRGGDDVRRELALVARQLAHDPAERLLGRGAPGAPAAGQGGWYRNRRA